LEQSKIINVIDSRELERDAGGKPLRTFPHPALRVRRNANNLRRDATEAKQQAKEARRISARPGSYFLWS
jgi:hypothetical protein